MIIDAHSHIGDVLYENGGELIFKDGAGFPAKQTACEKAMFREPLSVLLINKLFPSLELNAERRRNAAATLENFRDSLEDTGISQVVCAPIAPYVTFENIIGAYNVDKRIVAFTSPDFFAENTTAALYSDLRGMIAKGVKIHPIIQEVEADSKEVKEAVDIVSGFSVPVLLHAGRARYYPAGEKKNTFINNASIDKVERLIAAFPNVKFIIGHAGLGEVRAVLDRLPKYKNAYVDTSFQPPEAIKALISAFGGYRVLFASDWPFGRRDIAVKAAEAACGNDASLKKAIMRDNAAYLLNLD